MTSDHRRGPLCIAGAGRAAGALAHALHKAGWEIGAVVCRTQESARAAAQRIGAGRPAAFDDEFPLGDVLILGVPDDAIAEAAQELAARTSASLPGVALHLSGARAANELRPLAERGISIGSLHPIRALPAGEPPETLAGTWFGLEGEGKALESARRMVDDLQGRAIEIPEGSKVLYHAAATFASNAVVASFDSALRLADAAGLDPEEARQALGFMLEAAARQAAAKGPKGALTGPVARGDEETIACHLKAIARLEQPELEALYRAFTKMLRNLALQGSED